ncbi:MAG: amino acid permease [Sphingobacteriales bacterium]|nr:MAG: amino acid permease [Sphingobacteriales bacterium]
MSLSQLLRKKPLTVVLEDPDSHHPEGGAPKLNAVLGVRDLTFFAIAAIVGAGIFSTIGKASFDGGPGIVFLFLFVAVACGFSALCYAEFASLVPVSGSAYTYSYVVFGEIFAWMIGWDLLMEYAIGNIAVAISWSDYCTSLLDGFGLHIPAWLQMDYWTAQASTTELAKSAWTTAPQLGNLRIICDLPAFLITAVITAVVYVGIQESRRTANAMVILKLLVIGLVIVAGAFYVQPANWHPFLPNGMSGVLKGTAAVFFAYIGFDAISTTAEECRNPQRDLPRAMMYSLVICTIIYVLIALVLTGMVSYTTLDVGDPLAAVFAQVGQPWIAGIIAASAVIATASVLLVFQLGQPRIWMAMSRDGLLPKKFSELHPRYKTPGFSTILTGFVVGIPALFLNLETVVDLTSVGTLFAFVLVCAGVIKMHADRLKTPSEKAGRFRVPYVNGKWVVPVLVIGTLGSFLYLRSAELPQLLKLNRETIPYVAFTVLLVFVAIKSFLSNWSLIPVLGLLSCSYLLCESGTSNWERFLLWLLIGLVVYFGYSKRNSKLADKALSGN